MSLFRKNTDSVKASEIIKYKIKKNGGRILVSSVRGNTYEIRANRDGKSFSCVVFLFTLLLLPEYSDMPAPVLPRPDHRHENSLFLAMEIIINKISYLFSLFIPYKLLACLMCFVLKSI